MAETVDLVAERAGLCSKAGSFYRDILAESEIQKAEQLAQLCCNTRVYTQLENAQKAVLSGGYFEDHWKVIRFTDSQILYYGTDRALQKRYRIPYENGAAISRPGFLTVRRHFLPVVDTSLSVLQYGLKFDDTSNLLAQIGEGATQVVREGGFANYSTDQEYNPSNGQKNANYAPLTPADSTGRAHCPNKGTYVLGNGSAPINGINFQDGFSIGIYLYNNRETPSSCAGLLFQINDVELSVGLTSTGLWMLYDSSDSDVLGLNGTFLMDAEHKTWRHLGLTFKGTTMQVYADGLLVLTKELPEGTTYQLTKVRGTHPQAPPAASALYVDDLVIYSGELNEEAFKYLTTNAAPETFDVEGLAVNDKPLVMPGGTGDVVFSEDTQLLYGLLIPKDVFVNIIELDDGTFLYAGSDFESRYGLINFNENPVKILGGMKLMARTYIERRRNIYSYILGIDDVYGPVDRIMDYYRRSQSPRSLYLAAAQAAGMPVVREDCQILNVVPLHEGVAYLTDKGRYDAPFPHTHLQVNTRLTSGFVIGSEDLFQMYGPHDPLPHLEGVQLREACSVPGLFAANASGAIQGENGEYRPAFVADDTEALDKYYAYLEGVQNLAPETPGVTYPVTGNVMYHLLHQILPHRYIIVRVNETVMPHKMQLRIYEFLREQRPLGSVLLYAPINHRIVETE